MTRGEPIAAASAQIRSNPSASSIDAQEWVLVTASPASASAARAAADVPARYPDRLHAAVPEARELVEQPAIEA